MLSTPTSRAKLEVELPHHRFEHLTENVRMQDHSEIAYFSERLKCTPILLDSADLGLVNRPRLWWTRINWSQVRINPITKRPMRWTKVDKLFRLHLDVDYTDASSIDTGDLQFHPSIVQHQTRIPCFTTPAPTSEGRSAPRSLRGKIHPEVKQRWLQDNRQYAPWCYEECALLRDGEGHLHAIPASVKEQLHGYPKEYTKVKGVTEQSRHRLMANSWHLQVAKFLLVLLLQNACSTTAGTMVHMEVHRPPYQSAIQTVLAVTTAVTPTLGPGPWPNDAFTMPPTTNSLHHWQTALTLDHPGLHPGPPEPGLVSTIKAWQALHSDLPNLRRAVVQEIQDIIEDFQPEVRQWFHQLPTHIQQVYRQQEGPAWVTMIPVFLHLLQMAGFPADYFDALKMDLNQGFSVLGTLNPGAGWRPRTDQRYSFPITMDQFGRLNRSYIQKKLKAHRVDPHWRTMLDELLCEQALGRVSGPYTNPSWWPVQAITPNQLPMIPCPDQELCPSVCFAVCQSDKVRRCEDYRRSFHNDTVCCFDTPCHHGVEDHLKIARDFHQLGHQRCETWCQDLAAAYRQFPLRTPSHGFTILITPQGPTLWRHHCLSFGATGSVWGFNRAADSLCFLTRQLLVIPTCHYVDDFSATEPSHTAQSSYESFDVVSKALGMAMKPTKAQPPAAHQRLLGVQLTHQDDGLIVSPCPRRTTKIAKVVNEVLETNQLSPEQAQQLAGKVVFLQSSLFGSVGKATLHPLYGRATNHDGREHVDLTHALRTALRALVQLLQSASPKKIHFGKSNTKAVLYTDAFFQQGEVTFSPSTTRNPTRWSTTRCLNYLNGWGYVVTVDGTTFYSHGTVPRAVLKAFCSRRAYIYFLEIAAHLLAVVEMHHILPRQVLAFIDNQPGQTALLKGYGRDPTINNVLAVYWSVVSQLQLDIHLEWVKSDLNISDAVSRHDVRQAHELRWRLRELDRSKFFQVLLRASADLDYACSLAAYDLLH